MYRCECCHREFEYPEKEKELLGEYYDTVEACPYCHSDEIFQNVYVDTFGDYIYPGDTYYELNDEYILDINIKDYLRDYEQEA